MKKRQKKKIMKKLPHIAKYHYELGKGNIKKGEKIIVDFWDKLKNGRNMYNNGED